MGFHVDEFHDNRFDRHQVQTSFLVLLLP